MLRFYAFTVLRFNRLSHLRPYICKLLRFYHFTYIWPFYDFTFLPKKNPGKKIALAQRRAGSRRRFSVNEDLQVHVLQNGKPFIGVNYNPLVKPMLVGGFNPSEQY